MHPKDRFNRGLAIVIAILCVLAWIGVLVKVLVMGDDSTLSGTYIVPLFLIWAMFMGLTRQGEGFSDIWEKRRRWVLLGSGAFIVMQIVGLIIRLTYGGGG